MIVRIIAVLLVLILVYATYTMSRASILLSHSQALYKESATFKTDYYVGKSTDPEQQMIVANGSEQLRSETTMVVLGDSTAVGTGASKLEDSIAYQVAESVAAKGVYAHVINFATSGAKIADVISSQLSHLDNVKASVIVVSVGANDATHFTGLKEYEKSLHNLIEKLVASGAGKILFATSPDMHMIPAFPSWFSHFVGYRSERESTILKQVVAGSTIRVVDLYQDGKLDYAKDHALYASDLFHPSRKGYAVWAKLFSANF